MQHSLEEGGSVESVSILMEQNRLLRDEWEKVKKQLELANHDIHYLKAQNQIMSKEIERLNQLKQDLRQSVKMMQK